MPNLNGTGPQGTGAMTGRRMGQCAGGYTRGGRCVRGCGYGSKIGRGYATNTNIQVISEKEEKEMLTEDAKYLEDELKAIKERLNKIK